MDYEVTWSAGAVADLEEIGGYIAQDDPDAALRMRSGIINHVSILDTFPFIGPHYPRRSRGSLRVIVYRSYRIFYDVSEDARKVNILHLRHGARDEPNF